MESLIKVGEQLPVVKEWTVKELMSRRDKVLAVMSGLMVNEVHYGVIPGCGKKPTLLKPGAEMLLMTFRLAVKPIEITDLSTEGIVRYRVILGAYASTGELAGTGVGECSSAEDKYQWRAALCKEEFDATPPDQKREKWKKDWVNSRPVYKTVQQIKTNPADIANTILKMGKKRSMIDLTLTTLGVSDKFRQDIDDIPEELLQTVIEAESQEVKREAGEVSIEKVMSGEVKTEPEKPVPEPKMIKGRCLRCSTEKMIGENNKLCADCLKDLASKKGKTDNG